MKGKGFGRAKTFIANSKSEKQALKKQVVNPVALEEFVDLHRGNDTPLGRFKAEYEKIKRALLYSMEREKQHLRCIKDLNRDLGKANELLETRSTAVEHLQKQVSKLDEERKRAVRSETFCKEREENSKKLIRDLKNQINVLESRIRFSQCTEPEPQQKPEIEDKVTLAQAEEKLNRRVPKTLSSGNASPFDQWKVVNNVWTPAKHNGQDHYALYASSNPGKPHGHEIVLKGQSSRPTPMEEAMRKLRL